MARKKKEEAAAEGGVHGVLKTPEPLDPHRGFQYIGLPGKTPEDYFPGENGIRPAEDKKPWGVAKTDISNGIEGATIPPLSVWEKGKWLADLSDKAAAYFSNVSEKENWAAWCVDGSGTPGNYQFRVYILPKDISTFPEPLHPSEWTEKYKKGRATTTYVGQGAGTPSRQGTQHAPYWYSYHSGAPAAKPATPPAPKAPAMPTTLRIRCSGCGHWFKMDDLPKHAEWACPGINGEGDWAMMCDNACGCDTLHQAASVKPGFPRKPIMAGKKAAEEKKEEVKTDANEAGNGAGGDVRPAAVAAPAGD